MDKLSRSVLDDVSRHPDEYALFYVRGALDSSAGSFGVKPSVLQSCIEGLEIKGYLKFLHSPSGEIIGVSLTYSGYRWKVLAVLKILDVIVFHILLPVIVSVVTTLIVSR